MSELTQADWTAAMAAAEAHEKRTPSGGKAAAKPATEPTEPAVPTTIPSPPPEPDDDEPTAPDGQPIPPSKKPTKPDPGPDEPETTADADGKDPDRVLPKERLKFREEKREFRKAMQRELDEHAQKLTAREQDLATRFGKFEGLEKAIHAGDVDAFAKTVGFKDWSALAKHAFETQQNPNFVRLQALEREREAREKRDADTAREQQTRAQHEAQERAVQQHRATLTTELKGLGGIAADFAADDAFVDMVFAEQKRNWDGTETISADEAAANVLGAIAKQHARVRDRFDRYSEHDIVKKHLSRRPAENDEQRPPERENPESRPRERTNHGNRRPSHSRTAEAGLGREQSDMEWQRHFAKELQRSS